MYSKIRLVEVPPTFRLVRRLGAVPGSCANGSDGLISSTSAMISISETREIKSMARAFIERLQTHEADADTPPRQFSFAQ